MAQRVAFGRARITDRALMVMPGWVLNSANPPDLMFDWKNSRAWSKTGGVAPASSLVTTSRASTAYANDNAGNWTSFASNTPRITNLGLLVEEARTNSIRNNSMQGAVAGTPGTLPTNWSVQANSGLTTNVIGVGTELGVDYIDLQIVGTTNSTLYQLRLGEGPTVTAAQGQTWTQSTFLKLVGGDFTNVTSSLLSLFQYTSGVGFLSATSVATPSINSTLTRVSGSTTLNQSTVGLIMPVLQFNINNASPVNFTLRIGWPQLENNTTILSTVASAVKAASGASGVNGTAVYSVGGGTGTAATLNCTWAAGVLTVNSVTSTGSYTVFPPSPATLTYVSGTATGWTGATVTLTPTDNSAKAFATSPIRTTAAAATRAADVITLTSSPTFGSAYSAFYSGTPNAPTGYTGAQNGVTLSDGSVSNRFGLFKTQANAQAGTDITSGGSFQSSAGSGTWTQSVLGKFAAALTAGDSGVSYNGAAASTAAPGLLPVGVNTVSIGSSVGGAASWNGFLSQHALWTAQRINNAQLQSLTT